MPITTNIATTITTTIATSFAQPRRLAGPRPAPRAIATFLALASAALFSATLSTSAQADTSIVMLGTGTPVPDGERAGSGVAVIHDGEAYLFDVGPGVVERASQAQERMGIEALAPVNIERLFLTHLHSDHVLDYPELLGTYWWRREQPISVVGPVGTEAMSQGVYTMLAEDTNTRLADKSPVTNPAAARALVTEIEKEGLVHESPGISIHAFGVTHGDWEQAYGYKVVTDDLTLVISGDTSLSEEVRRQASGADVLIHEVISRQGWEQLSPQWQAYHQYAHTLSDELAELAREARPGTLVLTHVLHYSAPRESVLDEVRADYDGRVLLPDDLDVIE